MALRHLKYSEIDFVKYDICIDNALNKRIYAFSWYLDVVSNNNWDVIVLDDYKAVLPLPCKRIKRQFFKRKVCQPVFSQQLGVFSLDKLTLNEMHIFKNEFLKQRVFSYQFNAFYFTELYDIRNCNRKTNYELNLQESYAVIKSHYSKNLSRNIKKATKFDLKITLNDSIQRFMSFKKKHSKHHIKNKDYAIMKSLTTALMSRKMGGFYTVKKDGKTLAIAFMIQTEERIIHLISVSSTEGKNMAAMAFLFDHIIKANANKKCIFDFEGSEILGVAQFFKSFGAVDSPYLSFQ